MPPRRAKPMPRYGNTTRARVKRPCANPLDLRVLVKAAGFRDALYSSRPVVKLEDGTTWG